MVILIEVVFDREFEGLEIADHIVIVECIGCNHQIDSARVPVGEFASSGVLGEHVPVFDFE